MCAAGAIAFSPTFLGQDYFDKSIASVYDST